MIVLGAALLLLVFLLVAVLSQRDRSRAGIDQAELAALRADRRQAKVPAGVVHYETHYHNDLHVHQAPQVTIVEAAPERPAVGGRRVVAGEVLARRDADVAWRP